VFLLFLLLRPSPLLHESGHRVLPLSMRPHLLFFLPSKQSKDLSLSLTGRLRLSGIPGGSFLYAFASRIVFPSHPLHLLPMLRSQRTLSLPDAAPSRKLRPTRGLVAVLSFPYRLFGALYFPP
jgi:hypothetical protein